MLVYTDAHLTHALGKICAIVDAPTKTFVLRSQVLYAHCLAGPAGRAGWPQNDSRRRTRVDYKEYHTRHMNCILMSSRYIYCTGIPLRPVPMETDQILLTPHRYAERDNRVVSMHVRGYGRCLRVCRKPLCSSGRSSENTERKTACASLPTGSSDDSSAGRSSLVFCFVILQGIRVMELPQDFCFKT